MSDLDLVMPKTTVLRFTDTVPFRRPSIYRGDLVVPAGVTLVQITWSGAARLIVFSEGIHKGTLVGAWSGNRAAPFPPFRVVSSQETSLALQGYLIAESDLSLELGVQMIPLG